MMIMHLTGAMSERSKEPDSKSGVGLVLTVGSNPTHSEKGTGQISDLFLLYSRNDVSQLEVRYSFCYILFVIWRDVRVVEGARLEVV